MRGITYSPSFLLFSSYILYAVSPYSILFCNIDILAKHLYLPLSIFPLTITLYKVHTVLVGASLLLSLAVHLPHDLPGLPPACPPLYYLLYRYLLEAGGGLAEAAPTIFMLLHLSIIVKTDTNNSNHGLPCTRTLLYHILLA